MRRHIFNCVEKCGRLALLTLLVAAPMMLADTAFATDDKARLHDAGARTGIDPKSGATRFIGFDASSVSHAPANAGLQALPAESAAGQHLSTYGALFGLSAPLSETRQIKHAIRHGERTMTRYQQVYQNLPVIGGELIVNQTASRQLISISGKVSAKIDLDVRPAIGAKRAEDIALEAVAKWNALPASALQVSKAELSVYDSRLISPHADPVKLVWRMDVTPVDGLYPINEFVAVDAKTGLIALHFNQVPHAMHRLTHDKGGIRDNTLPGTLACDETNPDCTGGSQDSIDAHRYAGATYNYYMSNFGRDSLDGLGMDLISTVRFCYVDVSNSCPFGNAFWNGTQMVYGAGFSKGEDVVGHELTHGVTQRESHLYSYYQSGAISESLSDVFGELVQQTDPQSTVTPATKWELAEDLAVGPIRNMANPPALNDPDRIGSPLYYMGSGNNGGIHYNAGVNNKAAYLMTDGGTFNGKTVSGLGPAKVGQIYYEVQTNLLTSGSDYLDLYYALYQACQNLVGSHGIIAGDCQQVRNATDAVEMNLQPVANFNPEAGVCPATTVFASTFSDGFESGLGNWTISGTPDIWFQQTHYAKSGTHGLMGWGYGYPDTFLINGVISTTNPITVPANAYLRFDHAFELETGHDGAIVEYSPDGSTWTQLTSLVDGQGFHTSPISSGFGNALGGKYAFSGVSHGYVSSRFNLSSLSGPMRFRWRVATDDATESEGWFVDNVQIYSCLYTPPSAPPTITGISAGGGTAVISFTAPASNTGSTITSYTASCSAAGKTTRTSTAGTSPSTVGGLSAGVLYSCSVKANNNGGSSPASAAQTVTPKKLSITQILMLLLD